MEKKNPYDPNLETRLLELKRGDPAYKLHELVFMEAFTYACELHGDKLPQKILDVGCGLGFLAAFLAGLKQDVVGIDISRKAIEMAKKEHPDVSFYTANTDEFAKMMPVLGLEKFDQALLNMVLHSVDDKTAKDILIGIRNCIKPEGTVLILVPNET